MNWRSFLGTLSGGIAAAICFNPKPKNVYQYDKKQVIQFTGEQIAKLSELSTKYITDDLKKMEFQYESLRSTRQK